MSRASAAADSIPPSARAIALLLASTPTVQDAQPGVLHQLLEFSHRYTAQVLSDALVYAEHAGRSGRVEMDDAVLAVQARVGWEFGGRVPKEYVLSLATQTNAAPLPAVPEAHGVRLPPAADCLTAVDFDLAPARPPPGAPLLVEEVEEVEESESDEDEDMEPAPIRAPAPFGRADALAQLPGPAVTPSDVDMLTPGAGGGGGGGGAGAGGEEGSEAEEDDGLFAGGDEEEEESGDEAMEDVAAGGAGEANGMKRKLVEEEDYD
ncbi:TFIID-31kDa-domain-containing protein [Epithele typhae]|uniref:TFIID-31kDa-domain-containing protein n=1 Tax=Epithele typhae TaxID=378194 RepID=UPI0020088215|nr:TFIID-31kDa-domain-containing protein [Epithele typhae]KAH9927126.1 TFIID-31kDa-domain-containing protein [Epithele typhae]